MEEHLFQINLASPGWRFGDDNHELLGTRSFTQFGQMLTQLARVEFLEAVTSTGKLVNDGTGGRARQTSEGALNQANYAIEAAGAATIVRLRESAFYVSHLDSNLQILQLQLSHMALQTLANLNLSPTDSVANLGGLLWSEIYDQTNSWKEILEICHALYDWLPWLLAEGLELRMDDDLASLGHKISMQTTRSAGYGNNTSVNWDALLPARFGWGVTKMTLDKLGDQAGKTRERVRQVEQKILSHFKSAPKTYHPALQAILEHNVTSHRAEIADALRSEGINLSEDWTDNGLHKLFECFGLAKEYETWYEANKLTSDHRAATAALDTAIRNARTTLGTVKIDTIRLPGEEHPVARDILVKRIKELYNFTHIQGNYALVSNKQNSTAFTEAAHQLFVSSPLSLDVIAKGIGQVAIARNCAAVMPPTQVLGALLEAAGLRKNDQGLFEGPKQELTEGSLQTWLYTFMSNSTSKIASKPAIYRAASNDGLSINSLGIYLSYQSWMRFLGDNLFTLVGETPSADAINFAKRVAEANHVANKNASYSVSPGGEFIFIEAYFSTPFLGSGVISIDSDLSEILGKTDRKITCCSNFESEAIAKTRQGAWHGFAVLRQHLMQGHGLEEGDTIHLKADNQVVRVIH